MANTSWMRSFTQRWGKYVIVPFVIAMLVGCEGKGDSSRRAFVEYLNTQIITSSVVGVCELTPAQRQAFGHYADDYDVLLAAYGQIFAVVYETGQEDKITGVIQSERDNLVFLNELRVARDVNNRFILRLKNVSSENRKKYSALKLPSDVKPVFDAAWNKTVTPLDETMTRYYFLRGKRLDQLVAMGEFLQKQGNKVRFETNGKAVFADLAAKEHFQDQQFNFFITQNDINHLTQQMVEFINSQQDAADAGGVN